MQMSEKETLSDYTSRRKEIPDGLEVVYNARYTILGSRHYDHSAHPPQLSKDRSKGGPLPRAATLPLDGKSPWGETSSIAGDSGWGFSNLKYGSGESLRTEKRISRLQRTIYILVALIILLIIAGATGGAIGSHMAVQNVLNARPTVTVLAAAAGTGASTTPGPSSTTTLNPSPARSSSSAASSISPSPTPSVLPLDCPGLAATMEVDGERWSFKPQCGVGWGGEPLAAVVANTFYHCIAACVDRNKGKPKDECIAIEFVAMLPAQGSPGNCVLRSQKVGEVSGKKNMAGASLVKM